ncbi:MAG: hypothetical protein ACI4TJ_06565 [Candidatus Cryptobacteroides sp.]
MDELAGVVQHYPWFSAARLELCARMASMSGSDWGLEQYSDAAMYVPCRSKVFRIMRSAAGNDYSDKDLSTLLKRYIAASAPEGRGEMAEPDHPTRVKDSPVKDSGMRFPSLPYAQEYRRTVRPAGGDFFSLEEYEAVRRDEDNFFANFKAARSEDSDTRAWQDPELGFCTETLAQIYAEQGYFAEAKKIYSRLALRYPEKSAYFASLIEKMQPEEYIDAGVTQSGN